MSSSIDPNRDIRTWGDWLKHSKADEVTEAERKLVAACEAGVECELEDGKRPDTPSPKREVGADLLRYLITGGCAHKDCKLRDWGVRLSGAYVQGQLDLSFAKAVGMTSLANCHFEHPIEALQTRFEFLNLSGSSCAGLNAQGAEVKGNVFLQGGFSAKGEVSLSGTVIGGVISCIDGSFENADGDALNAQGAEVKGSVFLSGDFSAKGEVSLSSAVIGGQLACVDGSFENEGGDALNAQGAEVKGHVFLSGDFSAKGEVSLSSAVIGGQLACGAGSFENEDGQALNAQGAEVKGNVVLLGGFSAKGEVSLAGAVIGGQLACDAGSFENKGGHALNAQGAEVKGSVYLRDGFSAKGEVSLAGAVIGGQLECGAGSFENEDGSALNAQGVRCSELFWQGLRKVKGTLNFAGAHVGNLVDDAESWGKASGAYLDGFEYQTVHGPLEAEMRLAWLRKACAADGSFSPQPYEQFARVLKRMGHDELRRVVLIEKEKLARWAVRRRVMTSFGGMRPFAPLYAGWLGLWSFLQWLVVGYGLRPFRSVFALGILFVCATLVFSGAYERGDFAPNSDVILSTSEWKALAKNAANPAKTWSSEEHAGRDYETFNRYAYAADVVVPIISLGQEEAWAPSTTRGPWGWHAWWARWVLKLLGWIVTALGAAAITGIIRRE